MKIPNPRLPGIRYLLFAISLAVPAAGIGQTLNLDSGIHTYTALTNTTVTLSGRAELHLTATNNQVWANNNYVPLHDPMPGCTIHLNSADAWLFLDNTRPSIALSYLSRIKVNGANASTSSNVRVTEYGMGSMIIPHGPSFQPLQVFTGSQFTGSSSNLDTYTFYQAASDNVPLNGNIGSFILKRGYMATIGRQSDSRFGHCYVAQDGDLKVGALPAVAHGNVGFIRVIPWIASGKKGWAGGNDSNGSLKVDPLWNYDWNNGATSTSDVEYAPIRQNGGWPSFTTTYNKRGSTHLLGFNEPNSSEQANMTVEQALLQWPSLMQSGLRLLSPSPTDGGKAWLYSFMDQVRTNELGLRCDAAGIHMYQCGHSASSVRSWFLDVHNRTHRKVWTKEFNNGANWTGCADPTFAEQAAWIDAVCNMMDNETFMERYAIYQWVETVRYMVTNDANGIGVLTPAGTNYMKNHSPMAYMQEYPPAAGPDAVYLFDSGDGSDRTGSGNNALLVGDPVLVTGRSGSGYALELDGVRDYVQLPASVGASGNFTFAAWVKWNGGAGWQRIFDIGLSPSAYMFLTPATAGTTRYLRFAIKNIGSSEQTLQTSELPVGTWTHVAVTLNGTTGKLFVNGSVAASGTISINPTQFPTTFAYLGESQFTADPLFGGSLDDVFFAGYALTDSQVAGLMNGIPSAPQFSADPITKADATLYQAYSGSLSSDATPTGLTFSKVDGPAWLNIAADGTLSGTPGARDMGRNIFHIRAANSSGVCSVTRLSINVTAGPQLVAHYKFDGNTTSSAGSGLNGVLSGTAVYGSGQSGQALVFDGSANYVTVPRGVAHWSNITVAAWVNWTGTARWERIFDFGNGQSQYMFLTPRSGSDTLRFAIKNTSSEQAVQTTQLPGNQWVHVAVTLDGTTGRLYTNGALAASAPMTITPSAIEPLLNFIGKSQWPDPLFKGSIDEFRVYNYALSDAEIAALVTSPASAPSFVAAGNVAAGVASVTPALPSGIEAGDILLLFVETANETSSISNPNGGTWAEVTGSPQGTGTAGSTSATRLTAFWSRYNGSQGAPTVSDSGNHQIARMIAIRGAVPSGNPWDVVAAGVESTADTSGSIPGATTTVADTLVVLAVAASLPDANGTANFSGWSNANLADLTERTDNTSNIGNGGALGIATGEKAAAGAYGNTAVTHATSAAKAMMSIAIKK